MKLIGFDATEHHRTYDDSADPKYEIHYPLREWGWDRDQCKRTIADAGLPVPIKSACYFCPASKKHEIVQLQLQAPEQFDLSLQMEDGYRDGRHYRQDGSTQGLGRKFTWREFMSEPPLFKPKG